MNEQNLAKAISEGLASEEERGLALRNLQTQMGVSLVNSISHLDESFARLASILDSCIDRFTERISETLESRTDNVNTLFSIINSIQRNQVALVDLHRKIVQSPNKVFPEDTISSDEKNLLALLKSFKSQDEKDRFFKMVEDFVKENS